MKLFLQQGWGMLALDAELLERRIASGVVLSPRISTPEQLERHSGEIRNLGGSVLFDPQFYVPRTEHARILQFPVLGWARALTATLTIDHSAADFCQRVIDYQRDVLDVDGVILPGAYTNAGDERWRIWQASFAEAGAEHCTDKPLYSTIAIGPDVVRNRHLMDSLIDETLNYPVGGFCTFFLGRLNDSLSSCRRGLISYAAARWSGLARVRRGREVILNYANQQALLLAAVGVEVIALLENFRNVRDFNPEIFDVQPEDDRQRAVWYYDAGTLSEFRIPTIALAYRRGIRDFFGPICGYCSTLLAAEDPSAVNWGEPDAFRHFLFELNRQWLAMGTVAANSRIGHLAGILSSAQARLRELQSRGVRLGERVEALKTLLIALHSPLWKPFARIERCRYKAFKAGRRPGHFASGTAFQ